MRRLIHGITAAYLYDAAHQLAEIRSGSDTGTLIGAAVHDADGHLTKLCENGTVSQTASDCTATGTGATTLQLVWNALDHLATATRSGVGAITESYVYDEQGKRIAKTSGATTTSYLYNGDAIHAEWSGSISGMPAAAYVHGANIDEPLLRLTGTTNGPGATQAAYIQDGLGSVVGIANITGTLIANQRFDAWGNKTTSAGTTPTFGYTGREPDATGLTFYRARYYHPGIGRFASRDPMGMVDAVSPYAYVSNNPINLIDPWGLKAQLSGTPRNPAYWGMMADAGGWLSGAITDIGGGLYNLLPSKQSVTNFLDKTQTTLDYAGLAAQGPLEVVAPFIDVASGVTSLLRGDYAGAGLSTLSAVPFIGAAANVTKVGRGIDGAADVAKNIPPIKPGSINGPTSGKVFPQNVKDAANAENPSATCVFCRIEGTATQVDHAIPRARGGNATIDNAQLACPHCNASKGAGDFPKTPPPNYVGPWPPTWKP